MTIEDSIITAALTVGGGVLVYVGGRIIERAFIDPVNAQADAITELLKTLELYAYIYRNPKRWYAEADKADVQSMVQDFRRVAAVLTARNRTVPWHGLLHALSLVPRRASVVMAAGGLNLINNMVTEWSDMAARVTEEDRKILSEATEIVARAIKNHLNMGGRAVRLDLGKYILELPVERQKRLMDLMHVPEDDRPIGTR